MDAITLLKEDHKKVERLFKRFEKAGDNAHVEKRNIVDQIIEELSKHAAIEEMLFYPVTRETVPAVEDVALESLEEHHIVKWVLDELDGMDPEHERFVAKVTVLIENVRRHVENEEGDYFPKVRDELGRNALGELGDAMVKAKAVAPTHPHPNAPDTPPGDLIANTGAGMVDRVSDTVSGLAQGGVSALQDVVASVLGKKKPRSAPKGSPTTKRTARKVRSKASGATEEARRTGKATTRSARQGAKATKSAAKATVTSTRKAAASGAKNVKSNAKRTATTAKTPAKNAGRTKATNSAAKGTVTATRKAAKATAKTAKTGAKRTATTARNSVKKTASVAKASAKR